MKKSTFFFLLLFITTSVVFTSCKKDEEEEKDNNNTPATVVSSEDLFKYTDANGVLVGVKSVTTNITLGIETNLELGTAVALFPTNPSSNTFSDAGTVSNNTKNLVKQSNNAYVYTPAATDLEGIDFDNGSSWVVSGSSNVSAFNYDFFSFPNNPRITSSVAEVSISSGYNFTLQNANNNADSVIFILASGNDKIVKVLAGNATSANFSASELASFKPSAQGLIQVTPYSITSTIENGKKYYFVNQVTVSKFANFKN